MEIIRRFSRTVQIGQRGLKRELMEFVVTSRPRAKGLVVDFGEKISYRINHARARYRSFFVTTEVTYAWGAWDNCQLGTTVRGAH